MIESYEAPEPINIGNPGEISIYNTVQVVCKAMDYSAAVAWDCTGPEGQYRKPSCNDVFQSLYPEFEYTDFKTGIEETCKWFNENYPNIRGVK